MTSLRADFIGKARTQSVVIQTAADYDRVDANWALAEKRPRAPRCQRALLELLTQLIEDFDAQYKSFPRSAPYETLQFLLEQNDLTLTELLPGFKASGDKRSS